MCGRSGRNGCECGANPSVCRTCSRFCDADDRVCDQKLVGRGGLIGSGCTRSSCGRRAPFGTSRHRSPCRPAVRSHPATPATSGPRPCSRSFDLRSGAWPQAGLDRRRLRAASSSGRLWCARYVGEQPLFEQAGRSPMRFQVCCVNHHAFRFAALAGKFGEDFVEHAEPAPAHEAIVDCLVRSVVGGRVAPAQAVANDEDDAADHPPVINAGNAMRQRKERLDTPHMRFRKHEQISRDDASVRRQ